MLEETPSLTVVMPVYNALPYFDEAMQSIVTQSFSNFRLAIYDDHSTDGSYEAALAWAARDPRISVARGSSRQGPTESSNAAAALAKTDLVARMDADDVMMPDRLEVQMRALAENPGAILVGSLFDMMNEEEKLIWKASRGRIGGDCPPIAHPTILYRRTAFEAVGGYRKNTDYFEDRDLYLRMADHGQILVVNRPLIKVRFAGQHTRLNDDPKSVLRDINRYYVSAENWEKSSRSISPMAFYSLANLALLGSKRPKVFGLMLREVSLAKPLQTLAVGCIVALAEISPRMARKAWQIVSIARGAFERKAKPQDEIYVWQPPQN